MDKASSRSFAPGGSIVKMRSSRRSRRVSYSRSGMLPALVSFDLIKTQEIYSRPRYWRDALDYIFRKLLCREVAILQQSARLHLNIANGAKFLDESAERMQRADGLREVD